MEHLGVTVRRVSTDVDNLSGCRVLASSLEAVNNCGALECANALVVEGDVVVSTLDRTVVSDNRNAGFLRLGGYLDASTLVVNEEHDATALCELLVGDGRELRGVALSVLDVGLEASVVKRLLEGGTVATFPARRRSRVGKNDAGACLGVAAAVGCGGRTASQQQCGGSRRYGDRDQ